MYLQQRNSDCKNSIFPRSKRNMHYMYMHTPVEKETRTVILCSARCGLCCKAATTQLVFHNSPILTKVRVNKNKTSTNTNFAQCGDYGNKKGTFSNSSLKWMVSVLATVLNGYSLVFPSLRRHSKIRTAQVPQAHSSSTLLAGKINFKTHNTSGFMAWHWLFSPAANVQSLSARSIDNITTEKYHERQF